jgi:ATP-dependent DNA helicase RecG
VNRPAPALGPDTAVQFLKGVGPVRARQLERLGLRTARDLLWHYPTDYRHRGEEKPLASVRADQRVVTRGRVLDVQNRRVRSGASMVVAVIGDGPARLRLTWFNAPYMAERLRVGRDVLVAGQVTSFQGRLQIVNPEVELPQQERGDEEELTDARPLPIYPLTAGLRQASLRKFVRQSLDLVLPHVDDPLPAELRARLGLLDRRTALHLLHRPDDLPDVEKARARLAFDEAFALQLAVGVRRARLLRRPAAVRLEEHTDLSRRYVESIGFRLTGAQRRVLAAIARDLRSETAMHRLVQGDVGCGKTVVAVIAMVWAVEAGAQAAFMAPTEVLARQQARRQIPLLAAIGVRAEVLTGNTPTRERDRILTGLRDGSVHCVFGTHALIQGDVRFHRLALAVIDEQHRFGVLQRAALSQEGAHVLVMSATPIPRSLALTVYGDLDLSIIDELPAGRTPVQTEVVGPAHLDRVYHDVRARAARGEPSYFVFPLVEESEVSDLESAEEAYERLRGGPLHGLRIALLHGRMRPAEKEEVARSFSEGRHDVLVATTVIEVGVDVPSASIMVVHHAERFGLAQLHQLRGRVGRGTAASRCVLVPSAGAGHAARERLMKVASTTDGFRIAEFDLEERGMGDLQGIRQHGESPFRLLHPVRDAAIVERARDAARAILEADGELRAPVHEPLVHWLEEMGQRSPLWSVAG